MPALTADEVADIALLARLHLEDAEAHALATELGAILDHFTALAAVDTEGVAPMTHAVPMTLRLRADDVAASLPVATALAAAPARDGDLLVVPAILPTSDAS